MKMDKLTIAQIQHRMSKLMSKFNLYPWSINDEIDLHTNTVVPCIPSRNQREGLFDGRCYGRYTRGGYNSYSNSKVRSSVTGNLSNRKQRKLYAIRKMDFKNAFIDERA